MLRLEKIGKQFESGTTALSEVNLEIAPRVIQRSWCERIRKEHAASDH
jgi:hypothetical protein